MDIWPKLFFSVFLSVIVTIDVVCILIVFVVPLLPVSASIAHGEWAVNLGLVFAGVSGLVVVATLILGAAIPHWLSDISRYQLVCLGLLGAYVFFVIAYLWRVLKGGI